MEKQSNFFDLYLNYWSDTEIPPFFSRWAAITGIAALLRRSVVLKQGPFEVYPNLYVMFVGDPGARKSVAIKGITNFISLSGYDLVTQQRQHLETFLSDLSAGDFSCQEKEKERKNAKSILDLESIAGPSSLMDINIGKLSAASRCCFVAADEFNNFIGSRPMEFLSTLGELWDYNGEYKARIRGKGITILDPTITILSGNTQTGLQLAMPGEANGQGFLSRVILVHGEQVKRQVAFPRTPTPQETRDLLAGLSKIVTTVRGQSRMTPAAKALLEDIYHNTERLDDSRFTFYNGRRFTQLLKLCIIHAAARCSLEINDMDVLLANTVLTYTELNMPKAMGEYGRSKHWLAAQNIVAYLEGEAEKGIANVGAKDILKNCSTWVSDLREFQAITEMLSHAGRLRYIQAGGENRYYVVKKQIDYRPNRYRDFSLIAEAEV